MLRELPVPHEKGSKPPFRDKRMVKAEDYYVVINHMKWMSKFSRVPNSGYLFEVSSMPAKETQELRSSLVSEAKDYPTIDLAS